MLKYDPKLSWKDFAAKTILSDDLDPVYVALYKCNMPEDMLMRWCAAFVAYYHMGTASQICHLQGEEFWIELWKRYDAAPRASERRHFRGDAGRKALREWANTYSTPENFFAACMQPSFMKLLKKNIPQIGTYFTWKCMDLREAVFGYEVDWTDAENHLVQLPTQGLDVIFPERTHANNADYAKSLMEVADNINWLHAPPRNSRDCGVAEAETICCMAKGDVADHILSFMPEEPFDPEVIDV